MEKLLSISNSTTAHLKRFENSDRSCGHFRNSKYTKCFFSFISPEMFFSLFMFICLYLTHINIWKWKALLIFKMSQVQRKSFKSVPVQTHNKNTHRNKGHTHRCIFLLRSHVRNNVCEHATGLFVCTVLSRSWIAGTIWGAKKQEPCQAVHSVVTKTCEISCFVFSTALLETFSFENTTICEWYNKLLYIHFLSCTLHRLRTNLFALREQVSLVCFCNKTNCFLTSVTTWDRARKKKT